MPLLDAILAYALTMLLVATAVTAIIRATSASARLRREELGKYLQKFYSGELQPVVRTELARLGQRVDQKVLDGLVVKARELEDSLRRNPGLPKPAEASREELEVNEIEAEKLARVTTAEMVERLRRTDLGIGLMKELGEDADAVFDKLAERYEALQGFVSESFRQKSRFWSTLCALLLAFGLNIDSFHLLSTYLSNDDVRAGVLAQYDAIVARYQEGSELGAEAADLKAAADAARKRIDALRESGFPIGWPRFPYCEHSTDPRCGALREIAVGAQQPHQRPSDPEAWWNEKWADWVFAWTDVRLYFWVLGCIVTGVLAGLGAPFWYDFLSGVARTAQGFRAGRKAA
jgi:hypothetical protein